MKSFLKIIFFLFVSYQINHAITVSITGPYDRTNTNQTIIARPQINTLLTFTADAVDDNGLDFDFTWTFQSFVGTNPPPPNLLNEIGTRSNVSYSIPLEGTYTLNVRADNRDGNINTAETDIVIFTVTNTQQIFVHPGQGNDALTVEQVTLTTPLNSITKAIEYVGPSDQIIILPNLLQNIPQISTYDITATINLNKSGNPDQKISIIALENNLIRLKAQGTDTAFLITNQKNILFKFIEFNGFNAGAIRLISSDKIEIDNCQFTQNKKGVSLDKTTNTTISSSFFKENEQGVYLIDSDLNKVILSTFTKNTKNGVFLDFQTLKTSEDNLITFSTFYDNGSEYNGTSIFDSALNLGNNQNNSFTNCLFVNNIKDYYSTLTNSLHNAIDNHVSFYNIGIEKDPSIMGTLVNKWEIADPFLSDPDNDDFSLLFHSSSPVIGKGTGGLNIGAFQGTTQSFPTTRIIFVDINTTSTVHNGQILTPYQSLGTALVNANPGDHIKVFPNFPFQAHILNINDLNKTIPAWGSVTIEGIDKEIQGALRKPIITCSSQNQNILEFDQKNYLHLLNFHLKEDGSPCNNRGIYIKNSRHIHIENIALHGLDNNIALEIASSHKIKIESSIIFDSQSGIRITQESQKAPNQFNIYDKLTIHSAAPGFLFDNSHFTKIKNTIIKLNNQDCIDIIPATTQTSIQVTDSLCNSSSGGALFGSLSGTGAIFDPKFFSSDSTIQNTNPWYAFLLKDGSIALNSGDPNYSPQSTVLKEFPSLIDSIPTLIIKTAIGRIDIGALEQSQTDVDGDNVSNAVENRTEFINILNPYDPLDVKKDFDNDLLDNITELSIGTSIINTDTDGDGFSDGVEVNINSDPLVYNRDELLTLIPKPFIDAHPINVNPTIMILSGRELSGKTVANIWSIVSKPSSVLDADLIQSNTSTTFKLLLTQSGRYEIGLNQRLVVTGVGPTLSSTSTVVTTIFVNDVPPTIIMPADVSVSYAFGRVLYFYGSPTSGNPSFDANTQNTSLSYFWTLVSHSNTTQIFHDITQATPSFFIPTETGIYEFQKRFTSSSQTTLSTKTYKIYVSGSDTSLPRAFAGLDRSVQINTELVLNGSNSGDRLNSPLTYYWRQKSGPAVQIVENRTNCSQHLFNSLEAINSVTSCVKNQKFKIVLNSEGYHEFNLVVSKSVSNNTLFSNVDTISVLADSLSNASPIANISGDKTYTIYKTINLLASGSSDRISVQGHSSAINYQWTQLEGPPVFLENINLDHLSFIPVHLGLYTFQLIVTDQENAASKPVVHTFKVEQSNFFLPTANAGSDRFALTRRFVLLDGSSSLGGSDPVQYFYWNQLEGPEQVELSGLNTATTSFQATKSGTYKFSLIVGTNKYLSPPDEVIVVINSNEQFVPVAIAGQNFTASMRDIITLDGSTSFDQDNDPLDYLWEQISGPSVLLSNSNAAITTFLAPTPALYEFSLVVNDGKTNSLVDTVIIAAVDAPPTSQNQSTSFDPTTILTQEEKRGCFIVTASFGQNSLAVIFFQKFRDFILLNTYGGEKLMSLYYQYSPHYADKISTSFYLKVFSQSLLFLLIIVLLLLPMYTCTYLLKYIKSWIK
ncbi:MAG: hypothetical protein COB02_04585 [Candidatus Cloacimonadota bacterium]|nr:MAG: hypothetical protein COB02_04585 [Candidatus Cloacimonadota bacterium]